MPWLCSCNRWNLAHHFTCRYCWIGTFRGRRLLPHDHKES